MSTAQKRVEFDEDFNINLWPVEKAVENIDLIENSEIEAIEDFLEMTLLREKLMNPMESLRPKPSIPTGIDVIDDFLHWGGIPRGELSLLTGGLNTGVNQIWSQMTEKLKTQKKRAAWVNSGKIGEVDFPSDREVFRVDLPLESTELMNTLEELIICSQFDLIGCFCSNGLLRGPQLERLRHLAKQHHVALVLVCPLKSHVFYSHFGLVIDCTYDFLTVRKASHRPTPFSINREMWRLQ